MKRVKFKGARKVFKKIRRDLIDDKYLENIREFQTALQKLVSEYDTTNWENRFVVGGALEVLFCALLNSIGYRCKWLKEARYDIEINGIKFSMKSNFTGTGDIIVDWEEPTLFFISDVGICYADPEMGLETRHTHDARVINVRQIKELIERNGSWLIPIVIPKKPKNSLRIKTASYDVAKSILEEINSKYLRQHLPEA
ncbi:MAG: hypothetical protein ABIL67_00015 [candidate division WOR-3 bacterium]